MRLIINLKSFTYDYYEDRWIGDEIEPISFKITYEKPEHGSGKEFIIVKRT